MSLSTVNVSLLNAATAKAQLVSLPRDMTVAELQKLAPKSVSLTVDGCTPAAVTTLGDLYDACDNKLVVSFAHQASFGGPCDNCCMSNKPPVTGGVSGSILGTNAHLNVS